MKKRQWQFISGFLRRIVPVAVLTLVGVTQIMAQNPSASVLNVRLRPAAAGAELSVDTREFVLEITAVLNTAAFQNNQPIRSLFINFRPTIQGRLRGAINELNIEQLADTQWATRRLTTFLLNVPITVRGSIADITAAEIGFIDKTNTRLPACSVELSGSGVLVDRSCER